MRCVACGKNFCIVTQGECLSDCYWVKVHGFTVNTGPAGSNNRQHLVTISRLKVAGKALLLENVITPPVNPHSPQGEGVEGTVFAAVCMSVCPHIEFQNYSSVLGCKQKGFVDDGFHFAGYRF